MNPTLLRELAESGVLGLVVGVLLRGRRPLFEEAEDDPRPSDAREHEGEGAGEHRHYGR